LGDSPSGAGPPDDRTPAYCRDPDRLALGVGLSKIRPDKRDETGCTVSAQKIQLDQITRDPQAWARSSLDLDRVADFVDLYAEGGPDALPPIEVVTDGDAGYLLADGWHRTAAAEQLGYATLPATIYEEETDG
jgi:hypothetical protein